MAKGGECRGGKRGRDAEGNRGEEKEEYKIGEVNEQEEEEMKM